MDERSDDASAFGVSGYTALKTQLVSEGLWNAGNLKPDREHMKAARHRAMEIGGRLTKKTVFNDVFGYLSRNALDQCVEPGFLLLRKKLQEWFPVASQTPVVEL